jgi:drug/metabolite transporter (DMT)-like permease
MFQPPTTTNTIVGFALIAAGTVMTAVGASLQDSSAKTIVPAFGAALLAAGLVSVVRQLDIHPTRSIVMGAALAAAGVIAAVAGLATGDGQAAHAVPVIGAAMSTGGIVALLNGANARASRSSS